MILLGVLSLSHKQICWIHFEAFIAETYVQLVATELRATLLADPLSLESANELTGVQMSE